MPSQNSGRCQMRSFLKRHVLIATIMLAATYAIAGDTSHPNVVMIMTDNHGAWTLGCYGNNDIRTPNIDRLASEGTLFDNAFASNPVCSPTRATTLTGLIPSQHGVHCFLRLKPLQMGPNARNTLDEFTSLPEVLKREGYRCGLVGKWHLGGNISPQEGFDDYWITMPHGGTSTFYDAQIIEDGKERTEPQYLTDFWTQHAVKYINQQAQQKDKPFFLFLAYNGPYSLSRLLLNEGRNRHAEYYRDKELASFPREHTHPWQYSNRDYHNNPVSIRRVATEVSGVDDGVGTVMDALKANGLDDNTIVIFLADQGWVGGQGGFFGMGDHTRPVTARDGMMKIPMIWRHPKQISAGRRSEKLVANYDVMPTLLKQLDIDSPWSGDEPAQPASPGRDFTAELSTEQPEVAGCDDDGAIFYEFESLRCIRTHDWKYTERHPNGPHELYSLKDDPEEFDNLFHDAQHADTRKLLKQRLYQFFEQHASKKYDLWNGGGSQTVIYEGVEEEIAQLDPVPPPTVPDGYKPQALTLPDGFHSQLIAGPPLVNHPTMGCFDDRGRLFVCDGAGVNMSAEELEKNLPNHISMLEDQDGDGTFDKSTVFADRMTFPMGGVWHDNALYVASPPNIWRLEDTDDDGVADKRDILVDKFGFTGNAASIHGCFFGPDGRLYWCDGYHGHEFKDKDGNVVSQRKGSYLFSCRTDGSDVRIHCGGGMDNPVEVDFTDQGDMIGTVNILYTRPRIDCLVHWQYGGAYPHREAALDELKVTGEVLGPIHNFGHVAISGTMRYRSGALDHRWGDIFFATEFNLGKVVRVELERKGSTFAATEREFLSCDDRFFRPTDVFEDADGSLVVIDTGGWFYRGCPTSQTANPDVLGGIYRITRDGMTPMVDPRGTRMDWSARSNAQLAGDLMETRFAVRERAIDECVRRGDIIIDTLSSVIRNGDIPARYSSIWALTRILNKPTSGLTPQSVTRAQTALKVALEDREAGVRQIACQAFTSVPDATALEMLIAKLKDESLAVRRVAANAIGRLQNAAAIPELVSMLNGTDRELMHAATYALIEIADTKNLEAALSNQSEPAVLIRGHVALQQFATEPKAPRGTALCDWPTDAGLQRELLGYYRRYFRSIHNAGAAGSEKLNPEMGQVLASLVDQRQAGHVTDDIVANFVAEFAALPTVAERVGQLLSDNATPTDFRTSLLSGIGRTNVALPESWIAPLMAELDSNDAERVTAGLTSIRSIKSDVLQKKVAALAAAEQTTTNVRLAAMETLLAYRPTPTPDVFATLLQLNTAGSPAESVKAAQLLGVSSLTAPQLGEVVPLLKESGPQQIVDLIKLFHRSSLSPELAKAFLDNVENARSLNNVPTIELSDIVMRFPPGLHVQANALLDKLKAAEQQKLRKLDELIAELKSGNAERGNDVFFSEKSKCATCHMVGTKGKRVGPDLTTIGSSRSPKDLLESIVFPSATIVRQYEPYTLVTLNGRSYSGLVISDTADSITVQQNMGDPVTVSRSDIDELVPSTVSMMPKGLEEALTPQQIADLVAWLQTLRK